MSIARSQRPAPMASFRSRTDDGAMPSVPAPGADALRRLAAELSGDRDLDGLFREVVEDSVRLFGADRVGLWLYDERRQSPLTLVAGRRIPAGLARYMAALGRDAETPGIRAMRSGDVLVAADATGPLADPTIRRHLRRAGVATACVVPIVFRTAALGILVLYHERPHEWSPDSTALARSLGDSVATALGNVRLADSVAALAARLRAIQDLAARLNGLTDVAGICRAITAEAGALLDWDTIRVYRVDHGTGWCEPVAFKGTFLGTDEPTAEMLRVRIGEGLTGWVAATGEVLRIADAYDDGRTVVVGSSAGPESMLVIPMSSEDRVLGVIVTSRLGRDQFSEDDQTTLTIFAGYAAQAIVNAEQVDLLRRQRAELEHQIASQRRLVAVNERLLSTLDPSGVLDLIADSLKAVVAYDSLTIYRVDPERGVRRPVIARDRFAELILDYEAPLGTGLTGWAVDHRTAVLANDAHLDARSVQIPGTPFEPESLVVVPLIVEGDVLGTLNIGRMGERESHFSENEFELTKLFAAQAAIALRNSETHGEVKVQAESDALTGLRNHGSFQRELGSALLEAGDRPIAVLMLDLDRFKTYNDTLGHPAGDELLVRVARSIEASIRHGDRAYRYGGDEFAVILADSGRAGATEVADRIRTSIEALTEPGSVPVSISIGVACSPGDGTGKEALVEVADQALYIAKGLRLRTGSRDPLVAALDETASAVLEGGEPDAVLDTLLARAARLLGTPHGYIYLVEPDGRHLVIRSGSGLFAHDVGFRLPVADGLAGEVLRTGRPLAVDAYAGYEARSQAFADRRIGAVVGVPLTSGGRPVGVIGMAATDLEHSFRGPEIDALHRFAQLASIALENTRLREAASRPLPHDPVTGLPSRESLLARIAQALTWDGADVGDPDPVAILMLDVDRFKVVNESMGHAAGDLVLRDVGRRIGTVLGPDDIVGRFGGDEFGIVLATADIGQATEVGERILAALKAPFDLDGRSWFLGAHIGLTVGLPGRVTTGDMLREAEVALIQAKADPMSRCLRFDPLKSRDAIERLELEGDLRAAVERDEFVVHYQPIVDLRTERVVGAEALVRWHHPTRGLVPPSAFIPLAEETGLIVPIGRSVLGKACAQARAWRDRHPGERLAMSVNLSAVEFARPELVEEVRKVLADTGLEASALELEITESTLMVRTEAGIGTLRELRALGVRLVLDDFGTGYSSLAYLRELPLDMIKIDRSFVTTLDDDDPNVAIVRAVLSLAHGLGISVVAEGIETPAQAERLRALGCDMGQGYSWSRPTTAELVAARLGRRAIARDGRAPLANRGRATAVVAGEAPAEAQRRSPKSLRSERKRLTASR